MSFIYNPENTFDHAHAATVAEHNGNIFCVWYMYAEKEHVQGKICLAKYNDMTRSWNNGKDCFPIFEGSSLGNPVIFSSNNKLHMFFVKLKTYWHDAQIYYSYLENENTNVWTDPVKVNVEEGIMVRHRPVVKGEEIFIPAYDEKTMQSVVYQANGDFSRWNEYSKIDGDYIQGDLIEHGPNEWQMFLRAAKENQYVFRSLTPDSGKSWNTTNKTSLPCPLSGIAALALTETRVLVAYNNTTEHKRTPISLTISENKGVTFDSGSWDVDDSELELSYPTLLHDSKQNIHLIFTYDRKMLRHVKVSEEELMQRLER